MLEHKGRYLQIAFNGNLGQAQRIIPSLPQNDRILIEAGTPFIKREGFHGIEAISGLWPHQIVADLKTLDGAIGEVELAYNAGATCATVAGSASLETINLFIQKCGEYGMASMIDLLNVDNPLRVIVKLKHPPDVVILHLGRDEETTRGKAIQYKHVNKIKSKYDVLISAAGGVDLREARSAIFNGASIVVANIVSSTDPWTGIRADLDVSKIAQEFLRTIE